jgi:hypothetical protein
MRESEFVFVFIHATQLVSPSSVRIAVQLKLSGVIGYRV